MSYEEKNRLYREMTEAALKSYMDEKEIPELLLRSMRYSLMAGGKRLRPCMCLCACEMGGEAPERALPLACGLEMIHSYSLIHDDLPCMDNDDYRRGKLTNHKVFGEGQAVLAGDGLLSYAFEIMLDGAKEAGYAPAYMAGLEAVAKGAGVFGMVAGQTADLLQESKSDGDADTLLYIHSRKTGALFRASLLSGAHLGGMPEDGIKALTAFSEKFGLLFQITDDILDVEGDEKALGKSTGKDAAEHKLTYPALFGLERAKRMAEETAQAAKACLQPFGEGAAYLLTLTEGMIGRRS